MKFSILCFIWCYCFKKSNGLLVLRAHQIVNTDISSKGIMRKQSFPRGYLIWYHCLSKYDWLFFLKPHQTVGHRGFFWKHIMEILRWKFPRSDLYEVTVFKNLMEISFPGAHWISGYVFIWKHFVKTWTWRHRNQPRHCNF